MLVGPLRHGAMQGGARFRGSTGDVLAAAGWAQMQAAVAADRPWSDYRGEGRDRDPVPAFIDPTASLACNALRDLRCCPRRPWPGEKREDVVPDAEADDAPATVRESAGRMGIVESARGVFPPGGGHW